MSGILFCNGAATALQRLWRESQEVPNAISSEARSGQMIACCSSGSFAPKQKTPQTAEPSEALPASAGRSVELSHAERTSKDFTELRVEEKRRPGVAQDSFGVHDPTLHRPKGECYSFKEGA
jgi:hypothetical protein